MAQLLGRTFLCLLKHTGRKGGGTRGKVRFPPVLQVRCVLRKTKHISTGWQCALRRADTVSNADTDGYGKVRTNTDWGTGGSESHVLRKFHSTWRSCWTKLPCANSNTRGERGSRGKSKGSPVLHVHGFHQKAKRIPTGWQSTLCNADTAGRTSLCKL